MLKKSRNTSVEGETCEQALAAFEGRTGLEQGAFGGWEGRCHGALGAAPVKFKESGKASPLSELERVQSR